MILILIPLLFHIISPELYEKDFLKDLESKYFADFDTTNTYRFYIQAKKTDTMEIKLSLVNYDYTINKQQITLLELSDRNSSKILVTKDDYLIHENYYDAYVIEYTVKDPSTNYFAFEITPSYKMRGVNVYICRNTLANYEDRLEDGVVKYFDQLSSLKTYKFYIDISDKKKIEIEISQKDKFIGADRQIVTLYEYYPTRRFRLKHKINLGLIHVPYNNTFINKYKIQLSGTYLFAFSFQPYTNMTSVSLKLTLKYDEKYEDYHLSNEESKYFKLVYTDITYRFFMSARKDDLVEIEISTLRETNEDNFVLSLSEYSSLYASKELSGHSGQLKYDKTKNSYTDFYLMESSDAGYIAFKFYCYKEDLFGATIKVRKRYDFEFNLVKDSSQFVKVMYSKFSYSYYLPIKSGQKVNIEFRGDFQKTKNQKIKISEYSITNEKSLLQSETDVLYYLEGNRYYSEQYVLENSYLIKDPSTNYIEFYIQTNFDVKPVYITAKNWNEIDLKSGEMKTIETNNQENTYKFYLSAKYEDIININMDFNETNQIKNNFRLLTIYEYENRNIYKPEKKNESFYIDKNEETKKFENSYTVSYPETNYIAIEIEANNKIKVLYITSTNQTEEDKNKEKRRLFYIIASAGGAFLIIVVIIIIIVCCIRKRKAKNIPIPPLPEKNTELINFQN